MILKVVCVLAAVNTVVVARSKAALRQRARRAASTQANGLIMLQSVKTRWPRYMVVGLGLLTVLGHRAVLRAVAVVGTAGIRT